MRLNIRSFVLPIIIINIVMFLLQTVLPGFTEVLLLKTGDILLRPWILVTSMFLHGSPMHLLFNMYALYIFGILMEQRIGSKRFLSIYFISGILAGIGFSLFQEYILGTSAAALGASGAVMGILGLTIILMPDLKVLFFFIIPMSLRTAGIIFAIIDIIGIFRPTGIANIAHLVGLGIGLLYGYYLLKKKKKLEKKFISKPIYIKSKKKKSIHLEDDEIEEYVKYGRI